MPRRASEALDVSPTSPSSKEKHKLGLDDTAELLQQGHEHYCQNMSEFLKMVARAEEASRPRQIASQPS